MEEEHDWKAFQQDTTSFNRTVSYRNSSYAFANITHLIVHRIRLLLFYNKQNKYQFKFVTKGVRKSNSLTQVEL